MVCQLLDQWCVVCQLIGQCAYGMSHVIYLISVCGVSYLVSVCMACHLLDQCVCVVCQLLDQCVYLAVVVCQLLDQCVCGVSAA